MLSRIGNFIHVVTRQSFADSFFSPIRTVYVVSDSQPEEIKRKQRQEELDNLEASRKRVGWSQPINQASKSLTSESMGLKKNAMP